MSDNIRISFEMNLPNSDIIGLALPNSTRKELLSSLRSIFGKFIFRRVNKVLLLKEDMLSVEKYFVDQDGSNFFINSEHISPQEYERSFFTSTEVEQNVEFKYKKFALFTTNQKLRDNDNWGNHSVYCASNKYRQLDFLSSDCTLSPFSSEEKPRFNRVPPREKDLICMEVEIGPKNTPQAKWWFTCSEQFMHAWTTIMHDSHVTFSDDMWKWCFTGNRLQTNTFLKWSLAHEDNGISPDIEDARKRYYRLRTESVSKKWVHLYCAIVMMARFGELPCVENIPNNLDDPKLTKWDLPHNFAQRLLSKHTKFFNNIQKFVEKFPHDIQNRYYDLDGTIFERKKIKVEEYLDRPSIEGENNEIETIPQKIDVENPKDFPSLFESIKSMCFKKEKISAPPIPTPSISPVPEPKIISSTKNTISFWWAEEKIGSWADACCPVEDTKEMYDPEDIPTEDTSQEAPKKEEPKDGWMVRFEKISVVMKDENEIKFEKIKLEKEAALEKMKTEMEKEMKIALEKIKMDMEKEMELTLNKIKMAFQDD